MFPPRGGRDEEGCPRSMQRVGCGGESVEDGLELGMCDRRYYDKVTMEEGTRDMAELKWE